MFFGKHLFRFVFWPHLTMFNNVFLTISLLQLNNKVLFAPIFYTNMFGSTERLIQFYWSLYPMLLFPWNPFNYCTKADIVLGYSVIHMSRLMLQFKICKYGGADIFNLILLKNSWGFKVLSKFFDFFRVKFET